MYQKYTIIGRLGADPTVNVTTSGRKVAQINVAVTERGYKKSDGTEIPDRTEWIPCVLWNGLAEICERYLKKGNVVCIDGKLRNRSYDDKQGIKRYVTECYADNLVLLPNGSKEDKPLPPEVDGGQGADRYAKSAYAAQQPAQRPAQQTATQAASQAAPSPAMSAAMDKLAGAFGAQQVDPASDELPF